MRSGTPFTDNNNPGVKKNCQLLSCRQKQTVDWNIIDRKKGELQVQFQALPKYCNFETYVIELEIYDETMPYDEGLMCNTGNTSWKTHSRRIFDNRFCSTGESFPEDCLQVHVVNFNYVYSGFYRLKITPYVNGSTRQAQRSYRLHINNTVTDYVKKQFSGLHLNASFQYRSSSRELNLGIPLLIDDPPDTIRIEVKFSNDSIDYYNVMIHVRPFSRYLIVIDNKKNRMGNENSTSIQCENELLKIPWPSCQVHKAGLACTFYNMTPGFYNVYVTFTDDRCMRGTVWAGNHTDPCFWVIKKEFTEDRVLTDALSPGNDNSQFLITSLITLIIVGIIATFVIVKTLNKRRKKLIHRLAGKNFVVENSEKTESEQTYKFSSNGYVSQLDYGQIIDMNERQQNESEVVLVYPRDVLSFMELVTCLRRVLEKVFECKVNDYFDPDKWDEISANPKDWLRRLIVERRVKIIVIASEVCPIRTGSQKMGERTDRYEKFPHPFDDLYLYAIRLIRDTMNEESYKNLFVVTFEGVTESQNRLEYFNPYTRFSLPKNFDKLFEHLRSERGKNGVERKNGESGKFDEKLEIRQFKSQLNRLMNNLKPYEYKDF
ncbi:hypothetical protein Phum_PHUM401430 [Pediculus humanus corporis]|uniref:SEFIR domain-containing protein n=1 Tax=Pediculus humanus subsp. corporis TaxID=121224 RepID=E0VRQ3_PEDHC|nr:uncharacterized protein Phum_PHUM401430 [Pediculus humanus corporis]EEB16059.1 hypothetical protein Phum_PHUM401430 [Pediculus humanus corporis]